MGFSLPSWGGCPLVLRGGGRPSLFSLSGVGPSWNGGWPLVLRSWSVGIGHHGGQKGSPQEGRDNPHTRKEGPSSLQQGKANRPEKGGPALTPRRKGQNPNSKREGPTTTPKKEGPTELEQGKANNNPQEGRANHQHEKDGRACEGRASPHPKKERPTRTPRRKGQNPNPKKERPTRTPRRKGQPPA